VNPKARQIILPLATFVFFVVAWELVSRVFAIPPYLMPAPTAIMQAGHKLGWALASNALATLTTILLGFGLSMLVGIPLGILVSASPRVAEAFYPLIVFTHAIPIIAIAPVIVVIFGTELGARLIIVVLIAFFPIMVATASGMLNAPKDMIELAAATGASKLGEIWTVRIPHAVSYIFGGLRIGVTVSVVGAIVSEFVSSDRGLGYLVVSATSHFDVPMAMSAVIVLAMVSVTLYQLVGVAHRLLFPWSIRTASAD
jgi:NitT/TauT family transport system permease protein